MHCRRLRAFSSALAPRATAAPNAQRLQPGANGEGQGYGPRRPELAGSFSVSELPSALAFFRENGFCVVDGALSDDELAFLNGFCDRTQSAQV